jgi:hypothetical protein
MKLDFRHIKKRVGQECMSSNLKEMQILCKKVLAEYAKEKWQYALT